MISPSKIKIKKAAVEKLLESILPGFFLFCQEHEFGIFCKLLAPSVRISVSWGYDELSCPALNVSGERKTTK